MQFVNNGFNTFKMNDSKDVKKFTNMFKYKCETLNYYVCFNIY